MSNNFVVNTLNADVTCSNWKRPTGCGDFIEVDIDVLGTPNFSLSLTPFCEADSEAVILSNFELTFTNCDNDAPVMTETWTLEEDTIEVASANAPLPDSLGYVNGDVVCQTIDLAYPVEAETPCTAWPNPVKTSFTSKLPPLNGK